MVTALSTALLESVAPLMVSTFSVLCCLIISGIIPVTARGAAIVAVRARPLGASGDAQERYQENRQSDDAWLRCTRNHVFTRKSHTLHAHSLAAAAAALDPAIRPNVMISANAFPPRRFAP